MQPGSHTVAAWVTYGCSQGYLRLQVGDVFRDRASMKLVGLHPEMEARAGVQGRVGDALRVGVRRWRRGLGLGVGLGRRLGVGLGRRLGFGFGLGFG